MTNAARESVRPAEFSPMGRKLRTQKAAEVAECRRLSKQREAELAGERPDESAKLTNAEKQQRYRERRATERDVALRMANRWWPVKRNAKGKIIDPGIPPHVICLRYEFWQAMSMGWNPLHGGYACDKQQRPTEPENGASWLWWTTEMDGHQRKQFATERRVSLMRPVTF